MALIRIVEATLSLIDRLVMWFVGVMLLVMTIVLFANSIGRAVLNLSFVGGPALGRLLMIWLTFMGSFRRIFNDGFQGIMKEAYGHQRAAQWDGKIKYSRRKETSRATD